MKLFSFLVCLFSTYFLFSQSTYFIDNKGKKVIIHERNINNISSLRGDYGFGSVYFYYHDEKGKLKEIAQSKVKEIIDGGRRYVNMEIKNIFGSRRIHEVILQNEKYLLTQYYHAGFHYVYVTDKSTNEFVQKKMKTSWRHKKDRKTFNKKILPYFKDCKKFVNLVLRNTEYRYIGNTDYNEMFQDISNMQCN